MPAAHASSPAAWIAGWSSAVQRGATPPSAASGAVTAAASATTRSTPPSHSAEPARPEMPTQPVRPVRRHCTQDRSPKASAK
jgi:hypothetical protein